VATSSKPSRLRARFRGALHRAADSAFEIGLARNQPVVAQSDELAGVRLVHGQESGERGLRRAQVRFTGHREGVQLLDARLKLVEAKRQLGVAVEGELRGSGQAPGGPGCPP